MTQNSGSTEQRVRAELARLTALPEFERAPVMRRLLSFLVERTLGGRADTLKAYTVAVEGLGRAPDFDAQSDSYPRVQVGRLRRMLDAHYGKCDGPRLVIRPGGYKVELTDQPALAPGREQTAPTRRRLVAAAALAALLLAALLAWALLARPAPRRVAEAPIVELTPTDVVDGAAAYAGHELRALIGDALKRTWLVRVREENTTPGLSPPDYRLLAETDSTGRFEPPHMVLTLIDARSRERLWSGKAPLPVPGSGLTLEAAVRPLLAQLIKPLGVIATDQRKRTTTASRRAGYGCLLDYDRYFRDREAALRPAVVACVDRTIKAEPASAPALAAASALTFDPQIEPDPADETRRGAAFARQAVATDPANAEAQLADARAAFRAGQCARGAEVASRVPALNPYNPETIGLAGYLLATCGDPGAEPLMRAAIALDPDVPLFYRVALALVMIERGDVVGARALVAVTRPPGAGMAGQYALLHALTSAASGDADDARRAWAMVERASGRAAAGPDAVLATFLWPPKLRARVLARLRAGGAVPSA